MAIVSAYQPMNMNNTEPGGSGWLIQDSETVLEVWDGYESVAYYGYGFAFDG
jgi:hypothetical protein